MRKIIAIISVFMIGHFALNAQIVVTDDETYSTGESSSVLDIKSDSKGLLIPRINGHNVTNPAEGLLLYDTVTDSYWYYKNNDWFELLTGGTETNRTTIGEDGHMSFEGSAVSWDDLRVSVNATTEGGSNPPTFAKFKDDGSGSAGSSGALHFTGGYGEASIADNSNYSLDLDHTIEFWIKPTNATSSYSYILNKSGVLYIAYWNANKIAFSYDNLGWQLGSIQFNRGDWNHIVVSMEDKGSTQEVKLYINNQEAGSITSGGSVSTNTNPIEFNDSWTDWELDNVAIWGDVRTGSEISSSYNSGLGTAFTGSESDLNGYWKLDETSGASFNDETSNGNDGTVNGTNYEWTDGHVGATSVESRGVYTYWFDPDESQELHFSVQLPHCWDEGTNLEPHVHWVGDESGGSGQDVSWGLEYTWVNIGGTYGNTTLIYGDETIYSETIVPSKHYITELPSINGSGKTFSSMLLCRIFRDAAGNGGTDDYTGNAGLLEIDFHYQIDAIGSNQEYSKN